MSDFALSIKSERDKRRRYRLRNMTVDRVDLVDKGANQHAHIMIAKNAEKGYPKPKVEIGDAIRVESDRRKKIGKEGDMADCGHEECYGDHCKRKKQQQGRPASVLTQGMPMMKDVSGPILPPNPRERVADALRANTMAPPPGAAPGVPPAPALPGAAPAAMAPHTHAGPGAPAVPAPATPAAPGVPPGAPPAVPGAVAKPVAPPTVPGMPAGVPPAMLGEGGKPANPLAGPTAALPGAGAANPQAAPGGVNPFAQNPAAVKPATPTKKPPFVKKMTSFELMTSPKMRHETQSVAGMVMAQRRPQSSGSQRGISIV